MPSTLIIPGVQVRTQFEPSPVLPGATGVLGVVGVADRGPVEPTPLGNVAELIDQFGPASRYTMPEIRTAFANGVSRVWVSRIAPGPGPQGVDHRQRRRRRAVCHVRRPRRGELGQPPRGRRHAGALAQPVWGRSTSTSRCASATRCVERIENVVADPDSPNDLFTKVNGQSRLVVAIDPVFGTDLPGTIAQTALADADAAAATATLRRGSTDLIAVAAKRAGAAGNLLSVQLAAAPASRTLAGADGPSIVVSTRAVRTDATQFSITVQPSGADAVSLTVNPPGGAALRTYGPASHGRRAGDGGGRRSRRARHRRRRPAPRAGQPGRPAAPASTSSCSPRAASRGCTPASATTIELVAISDPAVVVQPDRHAHPVPPRRRRHRPHRRTQQGSRPGPRRRRRQRAAARARAGPEGPRPSRWR